MFFRTSANHSRPIPLETVIRLFREQNQAERDEGIEKILRGFQVWERMPWTGALAGRTRIWYDPCIPADHPGHILTRNGREQKLSSAVKQWPQASGTCCDTYWVKATFYYIDLIQKNEPLPPIVAIQGRMKRDIYILDGNTRVLAAEILRQERPGFEPKLEVCLGRKSFFQV